MNTPIFTRFLYNKNDVVLSLVTSILHADIEQSLFWGYELYFSGFKKEVFDILLFTFEEIMEKKLPKEIKSFLEKKKLEWEKNMNKHSIIATLIHNIATYNNIEISVKQKKMIYAVYRENDVSQYKTKTCTELDIPHYRYLRKVCKFSIINNGYESLKDYEFLKPYLKSNISREQLRENYFYHWEYCAYHTPIWKKRIENCKGKIDVENKKIIFENDEMADVFYQEYGYEPDEQPIEITNRTIGKK